MFGLSGSDAARLARIERKLDLLLEHAGVEVDAGAELPPRAREALDRGKKIEAIKAYREATGVGLAEAKQAIDEAAASR